MLTIVVRFSRTVFGGITILSIGPSPTGSAWITWAFMDLASSLVLSGMPGSGSGALLRAGGTALLSVLGGDTGGDGVAARLAGILSLPNLYKRYFIKCTSHSRSIEESWRVLPRITADWRGCSPRYSSHRYSLFLLTFVFLLEFLRAFHPSHHRLRHSRFGKVDSLRLGDGISTFSGRIHSLLTRFLLLLILLQQSGASRLPQLLRFRKTGRFNSPTRHR